MQFEYWRHYLRARMFQALRRLDRAIAEYAILSRLQPQNAQLLKVLGYLLGQSQRWQEAAERFTQALQLDNEDANTHFNAGFAYERLGEIEKSIGAFTRAVELRPRLDRAWYGMGMGYARLGRHADAVRALEQAATLQPMNGEAWYALGMAHHATNNPGKVEEVVKHLFRFDPVMTRRLIQDAGRPDLAVLVRDLKV